MQCASKELTGLGTWLIYRMNTQAIRNDNKASKCKYTGHSDAGADWQLQFEHSLDRQKEDEQVDKYVYHPTNQEHKASIQTGTWFKRSPCLIDGITSEYGYGFRANKPSGGQDHDSKREVLVRFGDEEYTPVEIED